MRSFGVSGLLDFCFFLFSISDSVYFGIRPQCLSPLHKKLLAYLMLYKNSPYVLYEENVLEFAPCPSFSHPINRLYLNYVIDRS